MGIKHGVANLLGMGKYAAIEKRNKELEETVLKEKQRLQKQFAAAVRQEAEKAVAPYEQQKNADRLLINALQSKVSVLSESNMELSSRNSRMENRHQTDLEWRDRLLRVFAEMFYQVKGLFVRLSMPSYPLPLPTDKEDTETSFATKKQQQSRRP